MILLGDSSLEPQCSRAGCSAVATHTVNWRNPRIHSPERIKVWLACADHREYLREFLEARSFPVLVVPVGVEVDSLPGDPARSDSL
jgi:hypothetical protein